MCASEASHSADYVAQMQTAVSGVLDQIDDVNTYVDALLAHWAWVAATIDAAVGQGVHR